MASKGEFSLSLYEKTNQKTEFYDKKIGSLMWRIQRTIYFNKHFR